MCFELSSLKRIESSPYPTTPLAPHKNVATSPHNGLLGSCPAHSFCTGSNSAMGYSPTNIDHAMHTLSLSFPDKQIYMDTSATSCITRSQGSLLNYFPLKHPSNNAIIVGSGHMIQV